jgi:hypothetical protein
VQGIKAMSETKGFGRIIDTTTIDLGFAPNDLPDAPVNQDRSMSALEEAMTRSYDIQQFAEPSQAGRGTGGGGGLPLWGLGGGGGGGGGGFTPPPAPAPVPAPPPQPSIPVPPGGGSPQ